MDSKLLALAFLITNYSVSDSADYTNLTRSDTTLPSDKDTQQGVNG